MTASPIPALIGPTGCGKSDLAVQLARRINGEIISVDSGAIYQDMNIGTATPSAAMQAEIRHHLIDIIAPNQNYNVGHFYRDANAAVRDIQQRGKQPLLVGGTMMYFNILTNGLATIPAVPPEVNKAVRDDMEKTGAAAAHEYLARIDAASAQGIAAADRQRIQRALAVYRATGVPLSEWKKRPARPPPALRPLILLPRDRDALKQRIKQRLEKMWADGLEAETRAALARWRPPDGCSALRLVGYRQAVAKINGALDDAAMREKAFIATCQLVKRQSAWLQQWRGCPTADPLETPPEKIIAAMLAPIREKIPTNI